MGKRIIYKETIDDYDPDDDSEAFEKLVAPADWDGPVQQRHCTDVLCLVFTGSCWIINTLKGIYASTK